MPTSMESTSRKRRAGSGRSDMIVLTLNVGSSSIKAALFDVPSEPTLGSPVAPLWMSDTGGSTGTDVESLPGLLDQTLAEAQAVIDRTGNVFSVGHRVVHGGVELTQPMIVDEQTIHAVRAQSSLAPSHNPVNLAGIEWATSAFPNARQVAVFDTGFHSTLSPAAFTISGPKEWRSQGIRRYGFHGISHQYVTQRAARMLQRPLDELRIVSCHLGNGCSLAAVNNGRSVDTTMGFTPLDGLVMGSRSGSVDPGVLLHVLRNGTSVDELDILLNRRSGLLGLSGVSTDLRVVRSAADGGDPAARLAVEVFVHRLRGQIASMAASMNGLDALVFTAGIGEHDARTRSATANGLEFLGVRIDEERNLLVPPEADISASGSVVRTLVVHTNENWAIACAAAGVVRPALP